MRRLFLLSFFLSSLYIILFRKLILKGFPKEQFTIYHQILRWEILLPKGKTNLHPKTNKQKFWNDSLEKQSTQQWSQPTERSLNWVQIHRKHKLPRVACPKKTCHTWLMDVELNYKDLNYNLNYNLQSACLELFFIWEFYFSFIRLPVGKSKMYTGKQTKFPAQWFSMEAPRSSARIP